MVTVVSGIPRSGTSLLMRMLQAGGIPILTDDRRKPDLHNPRGYFEYEPVKRLAHDSSWLPALAADKAVKVIYRLLRDLPPTAEYRILFAERDLHEIFASQTAMLLTHGDKAAEQEETKLIGALTAEVQAVKRWLAAQAHINVLFVPFSGVLHDPLHWAGAISGFLGGGLDVHAMASAVDPCLYRNRSTNA